MQITGKSLRWALATAGMIVLAGCERSDPRLKDLSAGISKDSVLVVMEEPPKRTDPYLYKGQYIEAMFYPRKGKTDPKSVADRKMSPVVVINGKLTGWGWAYWDSAAAANNIPVAPKN